MDSDVCRIHHEEVFTNCCRAFGYDPMTEKFPSYHEFPPPRNDLGEFSDILDELTKIRQDIVRDSVFVPLGDSSTLDTEGGATTPESFRKFYRFDNDHSGRTDQGIMNTNSKNAFFVQKESSQGKTVLNSGFDFQDTDLTKPADQHHRSGLSHPTGLEESYPCSNPLSGSDNQNITKSGQNYQRYDDQPVVIPMRKAEPQGHPRHSKFVTGEHRQTCHYHQQPEPRKDNVGDLSTLPWGVFSQYENETFVKLSSHASNLSLLIGWGAIACGVVIFARSFFVSSMIWLNYGLPILAFGAVCLFLGILLNIMSEKMRHINDLKQSLTTHRILNPSHGKAETYTRQHEKVGLQNVHGRLLKLQAEINELIDECEHPE